MIKQVILILSSSLLIFSCNLINPEEDTPVQINPEVEFILNDSIVGVPQETILDASIKLNRVVDMKLINSHLYLNDYNSSNIGTLKKFNLNGEFIDSLENVNSFYILNNFIFIFNNDSISKYTENFLYLETMITGSSLYVNQFSDGNETSCIINKYNTALGYYNFTDGSSKPIGTTGNNPNPNQLEFRPIPLKIIRDGDIYYVYDYISKRIQLLNLDGSYKSELIYDQLEVVGNYGDLIEIDFNDNNFFLANNGSNEARIQMFKKSDFSYVGFIENNDFEKTFISATNDKLYIVSLDPTPKIITYSLL